MKKKLALTNCKISQCILNCKSILIPNRFENGLYYPEIMIVRSYSVYKKL